MLMPRTIDKVRATLPGGDLGPYLLDVGLSSMLLTAIGISLNALRAVVIVSLDEGQIAVWLRDHADRAQYAHANAMLSSFRNYDVPFDERALFDSLYPEYLRAQYPVLFDLLVADDHDLYPEVQ